MVSNLTKSPIVIALDYSDLNSVERLIQQLEPTRCKLKVGSELFTFFGPKLVTQLVDQGYDVFLDLKFHDIPNTVANACKAAADLGVWMINVHALGGARMLEAAQNALVNYQVRPLLLAVTILTSLSTDDLKGIGLSRNVTQQVLHLAKLSQHCGLDGVVCSSLEAQQLRKEFGESFCLVSPGIRMPNDPKHDQQCVLTPREAINAGADYLVIGRAITQAENPMQVIDEIERSLINPDRC